MVVYIVHFVVQFDAHASHPIKQTGSKVLTIQSMGSIWSEDSLANIMC